MRISVLPSVLLVLLGLHVYIPTTVVGSNICANPSAIKSINFLDLTMFSADFYYCYSSMPKKVLSNCYGTLTPDGDKVAQGVHHFYNISSEKEATIDFTMKKEDTEGEVYSFTGDGRQATAYFTDLFLGCVSYVKCYSGGGWGGADSEGEYAAIICIHPALCGFAGGMVDKLNTQLSPDKLEKLDQRKCDTLGIEGGKIIGKK